MQHQPVQLGRGPPSPDFFRTKKAEMLGLVCDLKMHQDTEKKTKKRCPTWMSYDSKWTTISGWTCPFYTVTGPVDARSLWSSHLASYGPSCAFSLCWLLFHGPHAWESWTKLANKSNDTNVWICWEHLAHLDVHQFLFSIILDLPTLEIMTLSDVCLTSIVAAWLLLSSLGFFLFSLRRPSHFDSLSFTLQPVMENMHVKFLAGLRAGWWWGRCWCNGDGGIDISMLL